MNFISNNITWNSVPQDILNHVYSYLPQNEESINAIFNVCKSWRIGCANLPQKFFKDKADKILKFPFVATIIKASISDETLPLCNNN